VTERIPDTWIETSAKALVSQLEEDMAERAGTFAERERLVLQLLNEVARQWSQGELERTASRHGDEVLVDGQRFRRHANGVGRYHTLCGKVEVGRCTYRLVGVRNGPTVVPLELEAGIIENATPALLASVLHGFATAPLRDYEDEMRGAHRELPSRATLERIAKRAATDIHEQLAVIEPVVREVETVADSARSISVGIDRTTIPMAEFEPALAGEEATLKPGNKRRSPPPCTVAYRMAYVATMALHDMHGGTVQSTRIAATAEEGPTEMMERLGAELEHVRRQRPDLPVVVVQDGAPELWNLVEEWFSNYSVPVAMKLIDRFHLNERLGQVAEMIERDPRARQRMVTQWHRWLDRNDYGIKRICDQIEARIYDLTSVPTLDGYDEESCPFAGWHIEEGLVDPPLRVSRTSEALAEGHLQYCRSHARKMWYASARKRGFPIGSGVTEGACKNVIAVRFKRSGQRWRERGASTCLQLRTLHLNGRLEGVIHEFVHTKQSRLECQ